MNDTSDGTPTEQPQLGKQVIGFRDFLADELQKLDGYASMIKGEDSDNHAYLLATIYVHRGAVLGLIKLFEDYPDAGHVDIGVLEQGMCQGCGDLLAHQTVATRNTYNLAGYATHAYMRRVEQLAPPIYEAMMAEAYVRMMHNLGAVEDEPDQDNEPDGNQTH